MKLKTVMKILDKNSPSILTGLAVGGMISTAVLAVRATPKALLVLEEEAYANDWDIENIPIKEMVKHTWKFYIPAAAMGSLTIACIVGANKINLRRNAALASLLSVSEAAIREYQEKVIETFGATKAQKVKDDIAADKLARTPLNENEIIRTKKGETLCLDVMSGRYFYSDIETLRQIRNELYAKMLGGYDYISLNEVYYEIGLSGTKMGDEVGWRVEDGMDFEYSSQLTQNGTPCLVLDYKVTPRYEYDC